MNDDKVYFNAGDIVRINKDLPNAPKVMQVVKRDMIVVPDLNTTKLNGIECMWFDENGTLNKGVFSTKDLEIVSKNTDNTKTNGKVL